jgi:serine/threonine protein phosphatase PrpC
MTGSAELSLLLPSPSHSGTRKHHRDAFIVLACDGIWDVMTNQDVVDFMSEKLGYTGARIGLVNACF